MGNVFSLRNTVHSLAVIAGITAWSYGQTVSVIPKPVSVEQRDGVFAISRSTEIIAESEAAAEVSKLINVLAPAMGFRLRHNSALQARGNAIKLELSDQLTHLGSEGYELDVSSGLVSIRARQSAGLFYGVQTLLQLLPASIFGKAPVENVIWNVPCVKMVDYPRFQWRGLLVDPARHFIPKAGLFRFIDIMALHKLNTLQIHLTDDQGWRIEIRKYPKLTETGSLMNFTTMRQGDSEAGRNQPGAYYTQEDIRQLVRYAAERYITIVPEIEMPAHTGAAIVSYLQIGLYPQELSDLVPSERWKANERVLAPRPQTVAFMQDVLLEVMELFPIRYIHIGGDEANTAHWKKSEEMQALQKRLGLKDEAELHSWFIRQMDTFLTRHGRRLVGWDEILQGGLAPGATVMSWRGPEGGITAANAGHDVVMAPTSHTYFDYYQGPREKEPLAIGGNLPLAKVYSFEPVPDEVAPEKTHHILGVQGQLWGEYISTASHREYMSYPRAAALSEVAWSPKDSKDYDDFLSRLRLHLDRLDTMGVNYRKPDF